MLKAGRASPSFLLIQCGVASPAASGARWGALAHNGVVCPDKFGVFLASFLQPQIAALSSLPRRNGLFLGGIPRSFLLLKWLAHFSDLTPPRVRSSRQPRRE